MARTKAVQRTASAAAAFAQKERQSTEQVTKSQSLTLVKNLVRISISTVCHIRNIFPSSCFQERSYAGMRIYQLDAASRDASTNETVVQNRQAYLLTEWLEYGVFEAINLKYLRRMEFLVVSPELNRPRESYSFDLDYPESDDDGITFSGTRVTTVESTKGQLVKLIRSLIQFSNTLEEVPHERDINIKLWYYDDRTPEDWEPKFFRAASPEDLSFSREGDHHNLRIRIGELRTPHHTLKVRFEGIDTTPDCDAEGEGDVESRTEEAVDAARETKALENDDSDDEETCDDRQMTRLSKSAGLLTLEAGQAGQDEEDDDDEETAEDVAPRSPLAANEGRGVSRAVSGMANPSVSETAELMQSIPGRQVGQPEALDATTNTVRTWVKTQNRPTITGAVGQLGLTEGEARQYMTKMVEEGLLRKDLSNRYRRVAPSPGVEGKVEGRCGDERGGVDEEDNGYSSSSQASSASDDSATQPPDAICKDRSNTPSAMPPPPAPRRRGQAAGRTPEGRGNQLEGEFVTPPVPSASYEPEMQPVPEKPPQTRMVSMGAKRVLDGAEMSDDEDSTQESKSVDIFDVPTGGVGSESTVGYEISLSQASTVNRRAKCSLAREPIRQSGRSKRVCVVGLHGANGARD